MIVKHPLYIQKIIIEHRFLLPYTLKKQRLKIIELEKVRFIKVNELKVTQVELFSFF